MTSLLTIQHDPQGKLLKPLNQVLPLINDLFTDSFLVVTPDTHDDYWQNSIVVIDRPTLGMAEARRNVIHYALDYGESDYFYCDLDRLIYWARNHPDELREVIQETLGGSYSLDYTIIGRGHLALHSHPLFQLKTEEIMNLIVKHKTGLDMDVFAGARHFSCRAAKWISQQSTANDAAQDIEWPLIVKENGGSIGYIEVNGLAYESTMLDIRRDRDEDFDLRIKNLRSVIEFLA